MPATAVTTERIHANAPTRLDSLRHAIQNNQVSFPAQVPIFACQHRPDIQWRLVELYFVHGWSSIRLGKRYRVSTRRIHQLLRQWVSRARTLGYLQQIPPEKAFAVPATFARPEAPMFEIPAIPAMPLAELVGAGATIEARPE